MDSVVRMVTTIERRTIRAASPGQEAAAWRPVTINALLLSLSAGASCVCAVDTYPSLSSDPAQTEEEHHAPNVEHAANLHKG